jgi:hypothetical protein
LQDACKRLLECFFGSGNVKVNPVREHQTKLDGIGKFCRYDLQGRVDENGDRVVQVNAQGLAGVGGVDEDADSDAAIVFLVAPHMYVQRRPEDNLCWCFSSPIHGHGDIYPHTTPWAISTYQFYGFNDNINQVHCKVAHSILYSVFNQLDMGGICENKHCALNNSDSVDESDDCAHLILCPSCLRKLYLGGIIKDVPSFLHKLSAVLPQEPFASCSAKNLQALSHYGFGALQPANEAGR